MSCARGPLAERLRLDQRLELGHELGMAAEREIGLDALLKRNRAEIFEPGDLRLREGLVGEVGERGATPESERIPQRGARRRRRRPRRVLATFVCQP